MNPIEDLADVLPRLARGIILADIPKMLPAAWKSARSSTAAASS
jgi:hypothetical protein